MSSTPPPPPGRPPTSAGPPPPPARDRTTAPPAGQPVGQPAGRPPAGQPPAPPRPASRQPQPEDTLTRRMLRLQQPPEEPEWHKTQTQAVVLAEQRARTGSREEALAAQQAYAAQQQALQAQLYQQHAQHQAWLQHQQYSAHYVTAHAQANPTNRPTVRRWVLTGLVTLASLFMALLFTLYYWAGFGLPLTIVSFVFAMTPVPFILLLYWWLDRFEAEPLRYLVTAFLYGALGSTFLAIFANTAGGIFLHGLTDPDSADVLTAVLVAPLTEETFKGVYVLVMWAFLRKRFNGLTDGIVYAGVVATGFAFTENIQYLAQAASTGGAGDLMVVYVMRIVVGPLLHPMFTTMIGIGVGIAATSRSTQVKVIAPFLGWCAAMLLHGLWNLGASSGSLVGLFAGYGLGFLAFCAFIALVVWTRQREGRIIGLHLRPYADTGWLSPEEVGMLASMKLRRQARTWARYTGGPPATKAMRSFQDTASELALLRLRMLSQSADAQSLQRERVLLDSMTARRREFAGIG